MVDLVLRRAKTKVESWDLLADVSERSGGESRTEYKLLSGRYSREQAQALVYSRIASWEWGSEPKPKVCPTCGRPMEEK